MGKKHYGFAIPKGVQWRSDASYRCFRCKQWSLHIACNVPLRGVPNLRPVMTMCVRCGEIRHGTKYARASVAEIAAALLTVEG